MRLDKFLFNLKSRFGGDDNEPHRKDIVDLVKNLEPDQRNRVWEAFINTYVYTRPPRRADFYRVMKEIGVFPKAETKYVYWYVCNNCNAAYSLESRACPQCKGRERKLHYGEQYPKKFIQAHESCYTCKVYDKYGKFYCPYWGRYTPGKKLEEMSGEEARLQPQICRECPCRLCCQAERLSKENYQLYRERFMQGETIGQEETENRLVDARVSGM